MVREVVLREGSLVSLSEEICQHISALRLRPGDRVSLFTPDGVEHEAELAVSSDPPSRHQPRSKLRSNSGVATAALVAGRRVHANDVLRGLPLTLAFSPLKRAETLFVVEKATELGCSRIQPVIFERTQPQGIATWPKWQGVADRAAEQCMRGDSPLVGEPVSFAKWSSPGSGTGTGPFLVCIEPSLRSLFTSKDIHPPRPFPNAFDPRNMEHWLRARQMATVVVGPEGGLTEKEAEILGSRNNSFAFNLGPFTLRSETAAIVALGLASHFLRQS